MPTPNALETLVGELTVSELSAKCGRSVEEIVGWALNNKAAGAATRSSRAAGGSPAANTGRIRAKPVNTRSATGREAYDNSVLRSVQTSKKPISAQEIRMQVGGTPQQARAALNRLIENGSVNYQGRARATRYTPA